MAPSSVLQQFSHGVVGKAPYVSVCFTFADAMSLIPTLTETLSRPRRSAHRPARGDRRLAGGGGRDGFLRPHRRHACAWPGDRGRHLVAGLDAEGARL